jgi:hypothetical protein
MLLLIARYKDLLVEQSWIARDTEHLPPLWLAGAGALAAAGMILLLWPRGTLPKPLSTAQAA